MRQILFLIPFSQLKEGRQGQVKQPAQDHQCEDSNPESVLLTVA